MAAKRFAKTDREILNAKPESEPYRLSVGGSLQVEVRPSGEKIWRYRYRIGGKQNIYVIGRYYADKSHPEHISLEVARQRRNEAGVLVKRGKNPTAHRSQQLQVAISDNANTFESIAKEWLDKKRSKWAASSIYIFERTFELNVYPAFGALPIKDVTPAHILRVMQAAEKRGAEVVACNIRQWCSAIFRYAIPTARAEIDPASMLKGVVERPVVKHKTVIARSEFPELLRRMETDKIFRTTSIALRLLLLTFVRPGELRGGQWSEFDFDRAEWRIPGERMKMADEHIVPLSTQAIALLQELQAITGKGKWLFPNYRDPDDCMTGSTMSHAIKRMGYAKYSPHGFRTTASTLLNELGYEADWIERQLAHRPRNQSRAAYNHAQYLSDRRGMMQAWADLIDGWSRGDKEVEKVIPLRAKAA